MIVVQLILLTCALCGVIYVMVRRIRRHSSSDVSGALAAEVLTWSGVASPEQSCNVVTDMPARRAVNALAQKLEETCSVFLSVDLPSDILGAAFNERKCLPMSRVLTEFANIWVESSRFNADLLVYAGDFMGVAPSAALKALTHDLSIHFDVVASACRRTVALNPCHSIVLVKLYDGLNVTCSCSLQYAQLFHEIVAGLEGLGYTEGLSEG